MGWCVAYFEEEEIGVLSFLKDGFRIMYVCFSFAIAARPVQ